MHIDQALAKENGAIIGIDGRLNPFEAGSLELISNNGFSGVTIQLQWGSTVDFSQTNLVGIDVIRGDNNKENITGSSGDDVIDAREGNDTLSGGDGSDTFVFASGHDHDTILDFAVSEDVLDLTGTSLSSLAEVANAANAGSQNNVDGLFINTSGDDHIFIAGLTESDVSLLTILV